MKDATPKATETYPAAPSRTFHKRTTRSCLMRRGHSSFSSRQLLSTRSCPSGTRPSWRGGSASPAKQRWDVKQRLHRSACHLERGGRARPDTDGDSHSGDGLPLRTFPPKKSRVPAGPAPAVMLASPKGPRRQRKLQGYSLLDWQGGTHSHFAIRSLFNICI